MTKGRGYPRSPLSAESARSEGHNRDGASRPLSGIHDRAGRPGQQRSGPSSHHIPISGLRQTYEPHPCLFQSAVVGSWHGMRPRKSFLNCTPIRPRWPVTAGALGARLTGSWHRCTLGNVDNHKSFEWPRLAPAAELCIKQSHARAAT
jgi:hypothetical protein